jgi:hypothetical protein
MDAGDRRGVDRLTIQEAARRLGISEGAVRKRVARDTLTNDKAEDGRVYVYLDSDGRRGVEVGQDEGVDPDSSALISRLEGEVAFLRDQVQRQQEIIAQQAVTMRQLTAASPQEASEDVETVEEAPERSEPRSDAGDSPTAPAKASEAIVFTEDFGPLSTGRYALGVLLLGIAGFLMQLGTGFDIAQFFGPSLPNDGILPYVAAWGLPLLIPIIFGYLVGSRPRGNNFWRHLGITLLLAAVVSFLPWGIIGYIQHAPHLLSSTYFETRQMWLPVGLAFLSSALIGNASRRRAGPTQVGGFASRRWSPLTLQLIGVGGNILAAVITSIFAFVGAGN